MKAIDLVVAVLATYRLSVLISKDRITDPLRKLAGCNAATGARRWCVVADLVNCPYCLGVWFAVITYLLYKNRFGQVLVTVLGIAGGQDLIQTLSDKFEFRQVMDDGIIHDYDAQ